MEVLQFTHQQGLQKNKSVGEEGNTRESGGRFPNTIEVREVLTVDQTSGVESSQPSEVQEP